MSFATLAHELRNPLAPLRNALELQRRAAGDSRIIETTRAMMERQVAHMVRLVDDLLDMSRITSGRLQLQKTRVALADVLDLAVETAKPLIAAANHEFTILIPQQPIYVQADSTRLAQVFANVLNNSVKYTDSGGHIWLTAELRGPEAVVVVRDTGIGITPDDLPRISSCSLRSHPCSNGRRAGSVSDCLSRRDLSSYMADRSKPQALGFAKEANLPFGFPSWLHSPTPRTCALRKSCHHTPRGVASSSSTI